MTDSWIRLCERVDGLLNRVALQTAVDTPAEALQGAKTGLIELTRLLSVQPWPDIDKFAQFVGTLASNLASADAIGDTLARVQSEWLGYQRYLIGDSAAAAESTAAAEPDAAAAADDDSDLEVLRSDPELASMFIAEALDHLSTIEGVVLQLEEAP